MVTYRSDLQPGGGMSTPLIERSAGNVVIPGSDELSMELLKQMFGIGVGPMEGKRRLEMNKDTVQGDIGDYLGSKRKATSSDQPPANYREAEKRLNDMLYMTGGYINSGRNMGILRRYFHPSQRGTPSTPWGGWSML